ncbi:PilN domain-containing protein [Natranaerofaba carboxydovora]|uniref:PilN domain-containing protein n=1 Tax=Natranaerofaba carboxydovora TaxID=2742683 RepID=UPI001F12FB2F|nr:PilN domain-containing protein [Natranaerofaba carboxydovora]UMZ73514.1 Fimbrial assembly protein (PilN) [Natranaerofaba carboxydovora]
METISLLPPEIKEKNQRRQQVILLAFVSSLMLILFAIVYTGLIIYTGSVDTQIDEITEERKEVQRQIESLEPYRQINNLIINYDDTIESSVGDMPNWGYLMNDISQNISNELWFFYFYMVDGEYNNDNDDNGGSENKKGELNINGYALRHEDVANWLDELEQNKQLTEVELEYIIESTDDRDDREVVEFYITARVIPDEFKSPLEREGLTK